jgi:hypothetical protein
MFERIKALMERWHDIKEINALSDRDLDDLGMSRDQVQAFARMPRDVSERVAHMAAVFGLTDAELHMNHDAYLGLLSTCGSCRDRAQCAHVLARGPLATPAEADFCLNAESFAAQAARPGL